MVTVTYLGPGQYRVEGLGEAQDVTLEGAVFDGDRWWWPAEPPACHCADFLYRKQQKGLECKHVTAALEHQKEGR